MPQEIRRALGSQTARAMTTAIDTNVLVAFWNEDDALNTTARSALDAALALGSLVIAAPVFAELLAAPSQNEVFSRFLLPGYRNLYRLGVE